MSRLSSPPPDQPAPAGPGTLPGDLTGKTLGDFHLLRLIGKGGMGQVYLAQQQSLKRKVALKLLRPDPANASQLERFKREAQASARLTHPNIVQVYAVGEDDGFHYIALEYVEGSNLAAYLASKGALPVHIVLTITRQVAAALQEAGEAGIVHRDIKPANILLTRKGNVKVTDFGLARCQDGDAPAKTLTRLGSILGTPAYMSPEQAKGAAVDQRTDLYSLGVTCYHMLAGRPPYRGESSMDVLFKHIQEVPQPLSETRPDLSPDLIGIVEKMLAKDPQLRYQNAGEVLVDLSKLGSQPAAPAPALKPHSGLPPLPLLPLSDVFRKRAWQAGLAALALLGIGLIVLWPRGSSGPAPRDSGAQVGKAPAPPSDVQPPKPPPAQTPDQKLGAKLGALVEALKDRSEGGRQQAVEALGKLGPGAGPAVPALVGALLSDNNNRVRERAAEALGKIGSAAREAIPALVEGLKDRDSGVREEAAVALGKMGVHSRAAVPALVKALNDQDEDVRKEVRNALKLIDPDGAIQRSLP